MSVTASSYQNFVGGEWVDSVEGETMEVINPSTGETIAEVPRWSAKDVDRSARSPCVFGDGPRSYDFYAGPIEAHTVEISFPTGASLFTFDFSAEGRT